MPLFAVLVTYRDVFGKEPQFTEILESYRRANRSMLSAISNSDVPLLKGVAGGRNVVKERFSQFGREMEKNDLFPDEAAQSGVGPNTPI